MTEHDEMLPVPAPQRQRVEILLQGDAAYEVKMSRTDGRDGAETVVMGHSRAPAVVELSAGHYVARMRSLTEVAGRVFRQDLEITPQTERLDLKDLLNLVPEAPSAPRRPQLFEYRAAMRLSARRPSSDAGMVSQEARLKATINPALDFQVPRAMEAWTVDGRFEIGISANDPQNARGWLPAADIDIVARDILSDGTLSIQIRAEGGNWNRQRLRLTLAISGHPAIRIPLPMFIEGCRILISAFEVDGVADALIRLEAVDPRKQTLVAALHRLDPEEAISMLQWSSSTEGASLKDAVKFLFEKYEDAWAATVAALILARSFRIAEVRKWALNLERITPHINDAGVAAAWARATNCKMKSDKRDEAVLEHLIRARKIGMPTFKATHGMALELLNALRGTSKDATIRSKARYEQSIWTRRAEYRLFEGPYSIWEQPGPNLRSGSLPEDRYRRVALGTVTKEGFSIYF